MATLFDNYEPTATYASVLHEMAKAYHDADSLIAFAEHVVKTYEVYLDDISAASFPTTMEVDDEGQHSGKSVRENVREMLGLDGPYKAENSVNMWRALVWMSLDRAQWTKVVNHWKGSDSLNPNAMRGLWMDRDFQQYDVPVAMICYHNGAKMLVMQDKPCHPSVDVQVGTGMISQDALENYNKRTGERLAYCEENGIPHPYRRQSIAFIDGVAFVSDTCQWGSGELQELGELEAEQATWRIYVQTFDEHHGYYVPLTEQPPRAEQPAQLA